MSDVDRADAPCSVLQKAVGEPAARRADIDRVKSDDVYIESFERAFELESAAADIARQLADYLISGGELSSISNDGFTRRPPTVTAPSSSSFCAVSRLFAKPCSARYLSMRISEHRHYQRNQYAEYRADDYLKRRVAYKLLQILVKVAGLAGRDVVYDLI